MGYRPDPGPARRKAGRPKQYGERVALKTLFDQPLQTIDSPVYGDAGVKLEVCVRDLVWRPVGILVRFVAVIHPFRGRIILMTTDLDMEPSDIIRVYGYRFKIEVSFKSALRVVGAFLYHFWMVDMTPITRKARNQYLHRKTDAYRTAVKRKLAAYHRYIQLGLIAQGIMLAIATTAPQLVWASFGSWLRTIRPGIIPSEAVVAIALRNTLPEILAGTSPEPNLAKFIQQRLDFSTVQARRYAA